MKRKVANDNRARLNAGIIASMVYNMAPFGGEDRKAMSPTDFVPGMEKAGELDLTKLSPLEQKDYFMNQFMKKTMHRK